VYHLKARSGGQASLPSYARAAHGGVRAAAAAMHGAAHAGAGRGAGTAGASST